MAETLVQRVRKGFEHATALDQLRSRLDDHDQAGLDPLLATISQAQLLTSFASNISPFERILLVIAARQQQRIECLEFFLKRQSEKLLEQYSGQPRANVPE